jgi:hypothetical protein
LEVVCFITGGALVVGGLPEPMGLWQLPHPAPDPACDWFDKWTAEEKKPRMSQLFIEFLRKPYF